MLEQYARRQPRNLEDVLRSSVCGYPGPRYVLPAPFIELSRLVILPEACALSVTC